MTQKTGQLDRISIPVDLLSDMDLQFVTFIARSMLADVVMPPRVRAVFDSLAAEAASIYTYRGNVALGLIEEALGGND